MPTADTYVVNRKFLLQEIISIYVFISFISCSLDLLILHSYLTLVSDIFTLDDGEKQHLACKQTWSLEVDTAVNMGPLIRDLD